MARALAGGTGHGTTALSLAEETIAARHTRERPIGPPRADQPSGSAGCEKCRPSRHTGTRHIEGQRPLGVAPDREALEQRTHRQRALVAEDWAKAMSTDTMNQPINHGPEPRVDISQGVQL